MQIEQDGKTIEVFTAEELKAKQDEAVAAATSQITKDLEETKTKLAGMTDKDFNFSTMRNKVDELEKQLSTAKDDAIVEIQQQNLKGMATDAIKRLADGDEDLEKKMVFHYSRLGNSAKTADEVKNAIRDAFVLSKKPEDAPDPLAGAFSGGGEPIMPKKDDPSKPALTNNQAAFMKAAYPGMTDEQLAELVSKAPSPKTGSLDGSFGKRVI